MTRPKLLFFCVTSEERPNLRNEEYRHNLHNMTPTTRTYEEIKKLCIEEFKQDLLKECNEVKDTFRQNLIDEREIAMEDFKQDLFESRQEVKNAFNSEIKNEIDSINEKLIELCGQVQNTETKIGEKLKQLCDKFEINLSIRDKSDNNNNSKVKTRSQTRKLSNSAKNNNRKIKTRSQTKKKLEYFCSRYSNKVFFFYFVI